MNFLESGVLKSEYTMIAVKGAIVAAMVIFLIGLLVFFNKKISEKVKRIVLATLIILVLVAFILLKIFVLR